VQCPELVVEDATGVLGGVYVLYQCKKDADVEELRLTREQAAYVGLINVELPEPDETGGHPRL
jgi:hypothetical protein